MLIINILSSILINFIDIPAWGIILIVFGCIFLFFLLLLPLYLGKFFFNISFVRLKNDNKFSENENEKFKKTPWRIWLMNAQKERIELNTNDKLKLVGYFIPGASKHRYIITIHGYHGRYYSNDRIAYHFHKRGYNVLMYNQRGHDESDGKYVYLGAKEKGDLLLFINAIISRDKNAQIILYGVSMGAFIVMTTIDENCPKNVKCAVEDCGYSSIYRELTHQVLHVAKIKAPRMVLFFSEIYARLFHHFNFRLKTKDSLKNSQIPTLFIHGEDDDFVPCEEVKINYNNLNPNIYKELHIFPLASHNESYAYYPDEYEKIIDNFADKFIKNED